MATGKVKWFNSTKRYGFIVPDEDDSGDIFVHMTELEKSGISNLSEEQKISYEIEDNNDKISAVRLELIDMDDESAD